MGESPSQPFQLSFNASLKIDFQGSRVTSDGGLILVRELDERLGFGELIEQHLTDSRRGKNTQFPFADLLRQSVYSRLAGYEDLNDAERLSQDPTFRLIGSEKIWDRGAALTSRLQTFETEMLAEEENFAGLGRLNRALIGKSGSDGFRLPDNPGHGFHRDPRVRRAGSRVLTTGTSSPPVFTLCCCSMRRVIVWRPSCGPATYTAPRAGKSSLLPEIERQQQMGKEVAFRADAAFAKPEVYEALEERGVKYAIRIPANDNLERDIAELLPRPVGRPSQKPLVEYKGFLYQAASWKTARRVVAKVEHHPGELFPLSGVHCDQPDAAQPGGGALLQQARDCRAVDQGRQAGGEDDAVELSPVPVKRGAAVAERDRVQPREPVAAAGAAAEGLGTGR